MAFKLAPKSEIKTKVVVEVLGDLGKVEKSDFIATFKKLPNSQVKEAYTQLKEGDALENDLIKQNIIGWEGVLDEDKNEISFNEDNLDLLMEMTEVRKALSLAFWQVQSGETARKN